LSLSERSSWPVPVRLQSCSLNWDRSPLCHRGSRLCQSWLSLCSHPSRSILCLWRCEASDPPFHPLRAGRLRLCNLLNCILPGRLLLPGGVERICVCTTCSHYSFHQVTRLWIYWNEWIYGGLNILTKWDIHGGSSVKINVLFWTRTESFMTDFFPA
jgi:hypothetical protein